GLLRVLGYAGRDKHRKSRWWVYCEGSSGRSLRSSSISTSKQPPDMITSSQHVYEVRPRKDYRAVDLISDPTVSECTFARIIRIVDKSGIQPVGKQSQR